MIDRTPGNFEALVPLFDVWTDRGHRTDEQRFESREETAPGSGRSVRRQVFPESG
jgi:hypothetical protein